MKTLNFVVLALALLAPSLVHASLDIRHEYKSETQYHSTRIKANHKLPYGIDLGIELKWRGKDRTDFQKDIEINEKEVTFGYHYKLNDEWRLSPGMPISFGQNDQQTFKPQLRLTYQPKAIKSFSVAGRYRLDIKPHETENKHRHRFTYTASYRPSEHWSWGYEGNFYYSDHSSYHLYNNHRTNYEHNVRINFHRGDWTPFIELGNTAVGSDSSHRELRTRVGIRYAFTLLERLQIQSPID